MQCSKTSKTEELDKARAIRKNAEEAEQRGAATLKKQQHPIYHKGMPVLVITPDSDTGYFSVTRIGGNVIRMSRISRKEYSRRVKK